MIAPGSRLMADRPLAKYANTYLEAAMSYVNFTDLRANMASHLDKVVADRTELVVTRGGKEPVVIMPLAELEGLRETLHLLSTEANATNLRQAIASLERGKGVSFEVPDE